jgi:hypothetical protein
MEEELLRDGIEKDRIRKDGDSYSTLTNLINSEDIAKEERQERRRTIKGTTISVWFGAPDH